VIKSFFFSALSHQKPRKKERTKMKNETNFHPPVTSSVFQARSLIQKERRKEKTCFGLKPILHLFHLVCLHFVGGCFVPRGKRQSRRECKAAFMGTVITHMGVLRNAFSTISTFPVGSIVIVWRKITSNRHAGSVSKKKQKKQKRTKK